MDKNIEFLNYIHQNAQMGVDTISQLIDITEDEQFKKVLESQYREYKEIFDTTERRMRELNGEIKDISMYSKVSGYIMINMKTLTDQSPSHISEMLIQGSTMGIIQITKKLKEYASADNQTLDLANRLLAFEQRNVDECKSYLCVGV